ncbi:DASH complex, subunit Dad4 [Tilletiaria anomala UBC 951]|uniref:DASH complex subunit DAD4 n=1 Tax=Tilletiaria anomala (strain ATCC 24038 / CBS 436.72 / UBC 951) TaxID=1037660 RepID=A0A066VXY4_TILAU|nr:DASH complex, subunit Dad4 [Tilletiaria anomala UBC 951]KDN43684.1 DASH complex, subunit Dad4 [Tilletiaria anomala UBC 951]
MNNPHEERHVIVLERIIRNVDVLNQSLEEVSRSVQQINLHNQNTVIASNLWESYRQNVAFNLQTLEEGGEAGKDAGN